MAISRRVFTQASLSLSSLMAINPSYSALENQLIRRQIPSTEESIPVIGIGTNRYGVGDNQDARKILKETLKKFHALGGTLIDTAPTYGSSELVLGDLIKDLGIQKDLFLASKVDSKNLAANTAGYHESLTRFNTQQFDLMQVHNFKDWQNSLAMLKDKKATGEIVIIQDADLEYDPSDYTKLIEPIHKNQADVVYGSRFMGSEEKRVLYYWHTLGNKFLTTLSKASFETGL